MDTKSVEKAGAIMMKYEGVNQNQKINQPGDLVAGVHSDSELLEEVDAMNGQQWKDYSRDL